MYRNQGLRYELYGLPGSGKTTIVNSINKSSKEFDLNILTSNDFSIWKKDIGTIGKLCVIAKQPLNTIYLLITVFWFIFSFKFITSNTIKRAIYFPIGYFLRQQYCQENLDRIILLDEGTIHKIWTLTIKCKGYSKKRLNALINKVDDCNKMKINFIYVECSTLTSYNRIFERIDSRVRNNSRFNRMGSDELKLYLDKGENLINDINSSLIKKKSFFKLNSSQPIAHNVKKFINEILSEYLT